MKRSLKLEVRSGTVTGFSSLGYFDTVKNKGATWVELDETTEQIVTVGKPNKKGIAKETVKEVKVKTASILNKNAIKGMLYKLTGHIDKINTCDEFSPFSKIINNMEYRVKLKNPKASLSSCGQKFKTGNAEIPSPDMNKFSIEHLRGDLSIYRDSIIKIVKSDNLGKLAEFLYDKKLSEEVDKTLINNTKKLLITLQKETPSKLFETLLGKINNKINGEPVSGWNVTDNMLNLLNEVLVNATVNKSFLQEIITKSKSTFFDATFKNWLKDKPTVMQGIEYGYKIDFDLLFNDVPEEILEAIKNGPEIASWAKGGIVTPRIEDYPYLYDKNDGLSDKIVIKCGKGEVL